MTGGGSLDRLMYLGDMKADPNRYIKYPLTWTAATAERVAAASNAREMSMAAWIREAIREKLEKLERDDVRDE